MLPTPVEVLPPPVEVRAVYVIPSDAQLWSEMPARITQVVDAIQRFVADEMKRHLYGDREFRIARESNGLVHVKPHRSKYPKIRFEQGRDAALGLLQEEDELGPPEMIDAELLVIEAYTIDEHGVVSGDIAGYGKRRACVSSLHLKAADPDWINSDDPFYGQVFPWISSEPISHWESRRKILGKKPGRQLQLGDVAGACFGAIAHELIHCFGPDNHKDQIDTDITFQENIMGAGRNMRAYLRGESTVGKCVLSENAATIFSKNLPAE